MSDDSNMNHHIIVMEYDPIIEGRLARFRLTTLGFFGTNMVTIRVTFFCTGKTRKQRLVFGDQVKMMPIDVEQNNPKFWGNPAHPVIFRFCSMTVGDFE